MPHRAVVFLNKSNSDASIAHGYTVSMIYHLLSVGNKEMAADIHGSRNKFRPFVHAREESNKVVTVYFSSVYPEITKAFIDGASSLVGSGMVYGSNIYKIDDTMPLADPGIWQDKVRVKTMSPIVLSSPTRENGRKEYLLNTKDTQERWLRALTRNISKRHLTFKRKECEPSIRLLESGTCEIIEYMGARIPSRNCILEIKGDKDLIETVLYGGVGERTGSGFGMVFPV